MVPRGASFRKLGVLVEDFKDSGSHVRVEFFK